MAVLNANRKPLPISDDTWSLLSHKQKKNRKNHAKRRLVRQRAAQFLEEEEDEEGTEEKRRLLAEAGECEAAERKKAEKAWLEREAIAQTEFLERKMEEERRQKEKEELKQRIRDEFKKLEETDKILAPDLSQLKGIDEVDRQEMLKQFDNLIEAAKEEEYSNPLAPSSYPQYGTELDVKYCSFYLKTGACRFGDRCSRHHMKSPSSDTILLPSMFQHISLGEDFTNDLDIDSCLEHEDDDTHKSFTEFFWDVFPEFQAVGHVTMFKVCCNHEPHLRGNVYVQYQSEKEAITAYAKFNGRFYASRQISCEFVKIEKWKSAICGQFHRNRCPKGKNCNFLHVFKNPGCLFMVHGSEVGGGAANHASLSVAGETAVRNLDNHPVVKAARARFNGIAQMPCRMPGMPYWPPQMPPYGNTPAHHSPSPHRGYCSPSPSHRGRGTPSPSHRGRGTPSPNHRGRGTPSPSHRSRGTPSPTYQYHPRAPPSPHYHNKNAQDRSRSYDKGRDHARSRNYDRSRSPRQNRSKNYRDRSPRRKH